MESSEVANEVPYTDSGLHPEEHRGALSPFCSTTCPVLDATAPLLRTRSPHAEGAVLG